MSKRLKKCPCGQVPEDLTLCSGACTSWGYAAGNCCNEWSIEFRLGTARIDSPEASALARAAWDQAPRRRSVLDFLRGLC
jgi:hypothetical protein